MSDQINDAGLARLKIYCADRIKRADAAADGEVADERALLSIWELDGLLARLAAAEADAARLRAELNLSGVREDQLTARLAAEVERRESAEACKAVNGCGCECCQSVFRHGARYGGGT